MIYDCFMFFNELDILEIRLNELNDVVDKFVICESTRTFSNKPKELLLKHNKERFKKFWHKIEHIIADESVLPEYDSAWSYENFQRDIMAKALTNCKPDDIIIISDVDEIPKAEVIENLRDFNGIKVLDMLQYNFYLNYINSKEPVWLRGTRIFHYKDLKNKTLTEIRLGEGTHISNAGWHFSFIGGVDKIKYKIDAFAHQEYNNSYYTDTKHLEKAIKEGKDIFERGYEYKIIKMDSSFPVYAFKNRKKYSKLILKEPNIIYKLKKQISSLNKRGYKRKIGTYKSNSDNILADFIDPNSKNILIISNKPEYEIKNKVVTFKNTNFHLKKELSQIEDKSIECILFDDSFCKISNIEDIMTLLRQKMTVNGYIIADIHNVRYFNLLKELLNKKNINYNSQTAFNKDNKRLYTKKSLERLINQNNYWIITFKGLNPIKSFMYKLFNILTFGNFYDSAHEKFLIVMKH